MIVFFFFTYDEDTGTTVSVEVEPDQELEYFFDDKVRKVWHKQQEEWYFSIVDVCQVLTDSMDGRNYWKVLKNRLKDEGNETVTNCNQFKMRATDGKMRKTDAATTEQLLRIIQSIPSKKAEPFKLWLAQVGRERLEEIADPEISFHRMLATWRAKGMTDTWISKRLEGIGVRKGLTDEWKRAEVKQGSQYAALTKVVGSPVMPELN